MRAVRSVVALLALSSGVACVSAVQSVYVQAGYDVSRPEALKHIAVVGWAPAQTGAADLAAHIAADLVKLHKNYLVHEVKAVQRDWPEACGEWQGVLVVRLLAAEPDDGKLATRVEIGLYRCTDGALLWRATGGLGVASDDANLVNLVSVYTKQVGPDAGRYAAPLFAVIKQLIDVLPDPALNDEEVMQKIELGSVPRRPAVQLPRDAIGSCKIAPGVEQEWSPAKLPGCD